jgi:hypothetical protein
LTEPRIATDEAAISQIAERAEVCDAVFDVLEVQTLARAERLAVQIIPEGTELLQQLTAVDTLRKGPGA